MAKLTDDHRIFMVTRLAMYDTPAMVAKALKESFGIDVPQNQIEGYDAESHRAQHGNLGKRWVALFNATRERFKDEVDSIPIANRTFRLRRLNQMFEDAMSKGAKALAAQLLEQAAKEVGETFTNKREHKHSGKVQTEELSTDDKRAALFDAVSAGLASAAASSVKH